MDSRLPRLFAKPDLAFFVLTALHTRYLGKYLIDRGILQKYDHFWYLILVFIIAQAAIATT